jgi:hypothetical protein
MKVSNYPSIYVTECDETGAAKTFPLELNGDWWVGANVTVTNQCVIIDGIKYAFTSKDPLNAHVFHRGKQYTITE